MSSNLTSGDKYLLRNRLIRSWRPYFSPRERDLLFYVFDNTIEVGRPFLDATYEEMVAGERSRNPDFKWYMAPIGIPRRSFFEMLARLEARGVLINESVERVCTRISINMEWEPEPERGASRLGCRILDAESAPDGASV